MSCMNGYCRAGFQLFSARRQNANSNKKEVQVAVCVIGSVYSNLLRNTKYTKPVQNNFSLWGGETNIYSILTGSPRESLSFVSFGVFFLLFFCPSLGLKKTYWPTFHETSWKGINNATNRLVIIHLCRIGWIWKQIGHSG